MATNSYFDNSTLAALPKGQKARAESVDSKFNSITVGFDKLQTPDQQNAGTRNFALAGGTVNVYTLALTHVTAYSDGLAVQFRVDTAKANTGASSLNVNTLGAAQIVYPDDSVLIAADLPVGAIISVRYSTALSKWVVQSVTNGTVTIATAQAVIATDQAAIATTQAGIATTQAGNAAASFISFTGIYYGSRTTAQETNLDPNGSASTTGDQYFNSTDNRMKVFNGTTWQFISTEVATSGSFTPILLGEGASGTGWSLAAGAIANWTKVNGITVCRGNLTCNTVGAGATGLLLMYLPGFSYDSKTGDSGQLTMQTTGIDFGVGNTVSTIRPSSSLFHYFTFAGSGMNSTMKLIDITDLTAPFSFDFTITVVDIF